MSRRIPEPASVQFARAVNDARENRQWEALRRLYHPDAWVEILGEHGRMVVRCEGALANFMRPREIALSSLRVELWDPIDDVAIVMAGSVRYTRDHGIAVTRPTWMFSFVDGLLYRSKIVNSCSEARELYERRGVDLGINPPRDGDTVVPVAIAGFSQHLRRRRGTKFDGSYVTGFPTGRHD